ncbi:uncharacterized protein K452DRAFT_328793 [Aplosporella prunicola CBS 121167]|uniref:Beta-lactamase-related domain-containing protein n=1 Tax=Aplosporella prunicola CBS 121167 TaxID=1176127 RepID=A0A6A6B1Z9_9PEZI|nr:uncharacterized protein K452DRAFT_328793 [Aplosporella prunicola CBS 121167]KAF2138209.1 hypothetical protein K452DRAFT_328793 [Aplosporella prunicola CBS 121167]
MEQFDETVIEFLEGSAPLPRTTFGAIDETAFGNNSGPGTAEPSNTNSIYALASCTEFITTITALPLKDPQILSFNEADQPIFRPANNVITLRHLLTHTSGMAYPFDSQVLLKYQTLTGPSPAKPETIKDAYKMFLVNEPGEIWMNSPGIEWAGVMVERTCGMSLSDYVQMSIFRHLGIKDMTFHIEKRPDLQHRLANFWQYKADRSLQVEDERFLPYTVIDDFGGSGLYGSAEDFLKICSAILRGDERVLSIETVQQIFTPQLESTAGLGVSWLSPNPGNICGIPQGADINFGLGGFLNLSKISGRRQAKSIAWSGLRNPHFWIDLRSGLAGVQLMHFHPTGDKRAIELLWRFEEAVYSAQI